jgi:hypothetical protein
MQIFVIQKIARQVEGEYVYVQAIAGFIDQTNAENFLKTYKYQPAETFNGVDCIVELGTVLVEVMDVEQFFGKPTGA